MMRELAGPAIGRAVARALDRLAEAAADELPRDIAVERRQDGLVLAGKRLALRWVSDARLRWLALAGRAR